MRNKNSEQKVKDSRFPPSLFFVYFGVLLLMSGVHYGLLVGMESLHWSKQVMTVVPMLYWAAVAAGLTLYARHEIRTHYENPMHQMADAARKVAGGDFSVYIPPTHTADKLDYLDRMLLDFNKMVEELGHVETLKTDFFSNVSHEIKTPIAVIQNSAEMLRREKLSNVQKEYADKIYWAAKRLADLISNLLKLNKLERQTILPEMQKYDLCAQLAECALNFEDAWEKREIDFEADLEDAATIRADASLMELVWNNLLSNAIKFTSAGGKVILHEYSNEKEIRVLVQDNGCGMDIETQKHIFEKFYQGDTSHAMAGNGLGLALALRILQLNGFQIEVKSAVGKGSTFTVVIPKE